MRHETVPSHASASPCQRPKEGVTSWLPQSKKTHDVIPAGTKLYVLVSRAVHRDSGENVHGLAHVSLSLGRTRERMYNPNGNQEVALVKAHALAVGRAAGYTIVSFA
jgi:hypothetical protein